MDNIKIYIVEDSSVIRENLIDALHENAPIEVVGTAEDERTALTWLRDRSHACDLAIVDIFLKNGSGLGVLKGMGELPKRRSASSSAITRRRRSAPSVSSSARSRCSTSRTSSTRCSAGSTATPVSDRGVAALRS
jgi:DNA-binding NarL/FixJ family response regulator